MVPALSGRKHKLRRTPALKKRGRRAFLVFDVTIGVAVTLGMLLILAAAAWQLSVVHKDSEARRQLRTLVEDELTRMRAGLTELPEVGQQCTRSAAGDLIEATATPGSGAWRDFLLVRVVGQRRVQEHEVRVVLAGYIQRRAGTP